MITREVVRAAAQAQYPKDKQKLHTIVGQVGFAKTHLELADIWVAYKLRPEINYNYYKENNHALP